MAKKRADQDEANQVEADARLLAHQINTAGIDVLVGAFAHLGFRMRINLEPVFGMPESPQPKDR